MIISPESIIEYVTFRLTNLRTISYISTFSFRHFPTQLPVSSRSSGIIEETLCHKGRKNLPALKQQHTFNTSYEGKLASSFKYNKARDRSLSLLNLNSILFHNRESIKSYLSSLSRRGIVFF